MNYHRVDNFEIATNCDRDFMVNIYSPVFAYLIYIYNICSYIMTKSGELTPPYFKN